MRIRPTRNMRHIAPFKRRWRWSLLVKIEGDPLNTQHAQEEEGLSLFVIVTNEDPHNAHQASAPTVYS